MRISVYTIYIGACLLAFGAAILSGVILLNTFHEQQRQSESAQYTAGVGQVQSMQSIVFNRMLRMQTISEEHSRQLLMFIKTLPADALLPENVLQALNHTIYTTWAPSVRANNSLNGYGLAFVYVNETTGDHFDRTIWAYWDLMTTGEYDYLYAYTLPEDGLTHSFLMDWENFSTVQLEKEVYHFDNNELVANVYKNDDFFDYPTAWVATDGNSFWCFTHMRSFLVEGVYINIQTWDVGLAWLSLMQNVLTPEANLVAFESEGYVMAATNKDEIERLTECRGAFNNGAVQADCISYLAGSYPITEIRDVYNALHTPSWDDVTRGLVPLHRAELQLSGMRYMAIVATLFSRDNFRTTIVWYQPWVTLQANSVGLTAMTCILTMLSTFVLTLLGVFGVLRPLMALGRSMRAVARALKEGDGEQGAALDPRKPSMFHEVEEIGQDFETIVVDFLGFSSINARDNTCAPKDPSVPFAVVFTDIQSSTALWGKDPAEMSRCVQAHHELIRELIHEHRLYEVKTVGDAFMVTTSSAQDALVFTFDVQMALFDYDWDWDGADEFYMDSTLVFAKTLDGPLASSHRRYGEVWNGLRVRVGVHYGMGDVKYDEVSKGYDYYGTVVNAAARIEALAHGGQVVASQALLDALPAPLDLSLAVATPLGTVPLRGVGEPLALVEFKPIALQDRTFPPLRVERANAEESETPEEDQMSESFTDGQHSIHSEGRQNADWLAAEDVAHSHALVRSGLLPLEVVTHQLLALYHIVEDLLMPLAPQQFTAVAKALAKGWGISPPKSKADFRAGGMRLVQRMSETTKVLTHFCGVQQATQCFLNPFELECREMELQRCPVLHS